MVSLNLVRVLSLILLCELLVGCAAGTHIVSRANGEYQNRHYKNILVVASFGDIELEDVCEEKFKISLEAHGVNSLVGHEAFFPGKKYAESEIENILKRYEIDGILVIYLENMGINKQYLPSKLVTTKTGTASTVGNNTFYTEKSKTEIHGGGEISKPWANFSLELYDLESGEMAWYAQARTGGNAFASYKTVVRSLGGKAVVKLAQDKIIP